ncbi:MAG: hypothetical protein CME19_18820 [Gemmatimonadetes bacterium]|nr:hypothetical protein [Gemmatimonadota bacterium]
MFYHLPSRVAGSLFMCTKSNPVLTLDVFVDSIRLVAHAAIDEVIVGQSAVTLSYQGALEPRRPRNASEALIPRHIFEGTEFFYSSFTGKQTPTCSRTSAES